MKTEYYNPYYKSKVVLRAKLKRGCKVLHEKLSKMAMNKFNLSNGKIIEWQCPKCNLKRYMERNLQIGDDFMRHVEMGVIKTLLPMLTEKEKDKLAGFLVNKSKKKLSLPFTRLSEKT